MDCRLARCQYLHRFNIVWVGHPTLFGRCTTNQINNVTRLKIRPRKNFSLSICITGRRIDLAVQSMIQSYGRGSDGGEALLAVKGIRFVGISLMKPYSL